MLSHCRQQRICFSKCWAVCPISVNTDDSFWKHGKTKSERWDQHNSRSRKLKRVCWNSFERWVTQHLHFFYGFFEHWLKSLGMVMGCSLSSSSPHPAFFIFLLACGLVFIPLPPRYTRPVPNYKQARSLWSGALCTVFCPCAAWEFCDCSLCLCPRFPVKIICGIQNQQQQTIFLQFLDIMKECVPSRFRSQTCRESKYF